MIAVQLTTSDRDITDSIDTIRVNGGTKGALQDHQVVTGRAVHIIQYDGVGVASKAGAT